VSLSQLSSLTEAERSCLQRYLEQLVAQIGDGLDEVVVFGSVARGESWPAGMPIRSDLDLLVVTHSALPADLVSALIDATLPLFLECGRQIGPQFRTSQQLVTESHPTATFIENVRRDGIRVYP
jgi:predicted nucleotidyltransferase